jgi:hypothetical protein
MKPVAAATPGKGKEAGGLCEGTTGNDLKKPHNWASFDAGQP